MAAISNRYGRKNVPGPYRSWLESKVADDLTSKGVDFGYETLKLPYLVPSRKATYKPDFILPNGIIVEVKGLFDSADRKKHLLVKEQHPDKDIRFLFSDAANTIGKASKTTYAEWCNKKGFLWAEGEKIPQAWLDEPGPP